MFESIGNAWARKLNSCVAATNGFCEKYKNASQVINTPSTLHGTLHRHRQHTFTPEMGSLNPQKCHGPNFQFPKTRNLAPWFYDRAPNGRKHNVKMRCQKKKTKHFAMCDFPCVRRKLLCNHVSNSMHDWSFHWVFCLICVCSKFHVLDTNKEAQTEKKKHFREPMFRNWALPNLPKGAHCDRKKNIKKGGPVEEAEGPVLLLPWMINCGERETQIT